MAFRWHHWVLMPPDWTEGEWFAIDDEEWEEKLVNAHKNEDSARTDYWHDEEGKPVMWHVDASCWEVDPSSGGKIFTQSRVEKNGTNERVAYTKRLRRVPETEPCRWRWWWN